MTNKIANKKYNLISFEGIEGSGKSTHSKKLYEFFLSNSIEAVLTREPGGTRVGEEIRKILISEREEKLSPITEVFLNFSSRIEHVEKFINPSIKEGKLVICDRFFDSTYAYQSSGFGIDEGLISQIRNIAIGSFEPDITFLIDLSVEEALERTKLRPENNKYETLGIDFHQRVREGFLSLAEKNKRIVKIDGSRSIDVIFTEIVQHLVS